MLDPDPDASADAMDEALEILAPFGHEYAGGFANHGPMAAEALVAMGRADAVVAWTLRYRDRLDPPRAMREPIEAAHWREALGDLGRTSDWSAFFLREIEERPWRETLDAWVLRLAPGLSGAAAHGVIRTSHATRSLSIRDTPRRRVELARGLAYWAATYQTLPTTRLDGGRRRCAAEAVSRIETLRPHRPAPSGFIADGFRALDDHPSFSGVIDLLDLSGDLSSTISEVTAAFARIYLENASSSGRRVTFVHTVTAPAAVRLLFPHVRTATAREGLRFAWQAAAAMLATFGVPAGSSGTSVATAGTPSDLDEIVDRAIASKDEHAIKLAEACAREHALRADPAFLAAALDASRSLKG
jgi:hypothetical protein